MSEILILSFSLELNPLLRTLSTHQIVVSTMVFLLLLIQTEPCVEFILIELSLAYLFMNLVILNQIQGPNRDRD